MADPTYPSPGGDADLGPDHGPTATGMPGWVKTVLIVIAVLVVLFVILQIAGVGGGHGPGRH